ncbi:hypothetical protein Saro_2987 [Novosphingobium aromaticivorans DSM 12444]|uniref:Uncharacterized protein n=1 Tax=Novosphingobium aromaticivorans (strain ATCC 700278 / DSM 12444 / CCUG 56034 / CIP 105152 / NBRC 16084 / F199) TaxID=279238 RepID=Q2G401_NOVAD|nr:hypothetical protein [Novosphingobium aromaticivorans]ABD27422.1 hypothetical protein Saro_2987 [Novosphingobium aromaticivorans DSM 12444]SCY69029.1 hypothetical protein SAMN05660666_02489 [Novosphingobium aromaticivorans]
MSVDPKLLDYCNTDHQRQIMQRLIAGDSGAEIARDMGVHRTLPDKVRRRVLEYAARQGYAPEAGIDHPVAEGFELRGYSHFTKTAAGEPIWLKTRAAERAYWQGIQGAIDGVQPVDAAILAIPPEPQSDIIPWLQIGDAHIGMLASEEETGANFDISIAEREICAAAAALIDAAPACERLVINDLGDGTHYETFKAETEASGHRVDQDTRYWKMVQAYIRITRFIVERALTKARTVDYIANQGNHSRSNDIWIAALIGALYEATGRVNVLRNESPFIAYRMGRTFVMVHHGDKAKPEACAKLMSDDYAVDWGETVFRYIDGGHVHHSQRKELPGCLFESWNNLAPRDKYAHDGGWRSKQCMTLVLRSRNYGETARIVMPIERVRDLIRAKQPDHYVPPAMRAFAA